MADQPYNFAGIADAAQATGAHPEATISAPTGKEPVTLGDLKDDLAGSMARIGAILKRDLTDRKLWLAAAAMYFGPKVFNYAAPIIARGTMKAVAGGKALATPEMAKDLATLGLGDSRVNAGVRMAGRAVDAIQAARAAGAPAEMPAAMPPAATAAAGALPATVAAPAAAAPPPPASPVTLPPRSASTAASRPLTKPHLTLDEYRAAEQLLKQGYSKEEVLKAIVQNKLPASWLRLPSDADVAARVKARNETDRWPDQEE